MMTISHSSDWPIAEIELRGTVRPGQSAEDFLALLRLNRVLHHSTRLERVGARHWQSYLPTWKGFIPFQEYRVQKEYPETSIVAIALDGLFSHGEPYTFHVEFRMERDVEFFARGVAAWPKHGYFYPGPVKYRYPTEWRQWETAIVLR